MEDVYSFKKNTKDSVAWWVFWPALVFLGISVVVSIIGAIILVVFLMAKGGFENPNDLVSEIIKYSMPINIVAQVIGTAIYLPIYLKTKKEAFPVVTEKSHCSVSIWSILFILGVGTISSFIVELIGNIFPPSDGGLEAITEAIFGGSLWSTVVSTVIMAPIMEELMIRGLTLNKLLSGSKKWTAIIVSSIVFGVIHMNLLQGLNAFVLGVVLALVYYKTRSLITCMLCHAANNILSVVGGVLVLNEVSNYELINNITAIVCVVLGIVGTYFFFKSKDAKVEKKKIEA